MKDLNDYYGEVQNLIGHNFEESELLFQAFRRRSYSQEHGGANNEVLEFIGDRVLDFYVTKILMDKYGDINEDGEFFTYRFKTEGSLTNIKKKLVCKEMLAHRIDMMGFADYLYMGNGDIKTNKQEEASIKEDLFEAILGAVAIDSNWNPTELENTVGLMLNIDYFLEHGFDDEEEDYVALIQQWNQKENKEVPEYEFEELYDGGFRARLYLDTPRGRMYYYNDGNTKSEARFNVAKEAYFDLEEHDELFTIKDELPNELTLDNAINILQELAQKGYISMPEYYQTDYQVHDGEGNSYWECCCYVNSHSVAETAYGTSKKIAKKYSAYMCICKICNLRDEYSNED